MWYRVHYMRTSCKMHTHFETQYIVHYDSWKCIDRTGKCIRSKEEHKVVFIVYYLLIEVFFPFDICPYTSYLQCLCTHENISAKYFFLLFAISSIIIKYNGIRATQILAACRKKNTHDANIFCEAHWRFTSSQMQKSVVQWIFFLFRFGFAISHFNNISFFDHFFIRLVYLNFNRIIYFKNYRVYM